MAHVQERRMWTGKISLSEWVDRQEGVTERGRVTARLEKGEVQEGEEGEVKQLGKRGRW